MADSICNADFDFVQDEDSVSVLSSVQAFG